MSEFVKPSGVCFSFEVGMPASQLSRVLCKIASFLQEADPYVSLHRYDDWWEHDGLHFKQGRLDINQLFQLVNTSKNLLESTPADESVFVGITPDDNAWYLRYRVEWDEEESNLIGSCAVILPEHLAEKFRNEVVPRIEQRPTEKDSESFYRETIL
jgi:hypothetical protein